MVPNGKVEFTWGDGEHTFNIAKIAQALELEEKCGCGVAEIFERLRNGRWHINDVRETIRLALIGGGIDTKNGIDPQKAALLVKRYVDERPWQESVQTAMLILMAAIVGVSGDEVGKKPTAEQAQEQESPSTAQMDDSSAPQSTVSVPDLAGPPDKPTNTRSGSSARRSRASTGPTAPSNQ